ncbi:response regulator [Roseateles sp.]|uniref:response regulator n=1 Tax=Roseateles sp. TaxID=1971397 RepID=UPI0025D3B1FB|nr:response regulator [Roseateles sp.]MBV8036669.1 response regulator [Roseateles sp.]
MPLRTLTLGLIWLAMAALAALFLLLWGLRGTGGVAIDAALLITALLLPLPLCGLFAWYRGAAATAAAKSRLLAQISHEIRTPMNAVMGMTQLALQTPLTTEQRELLTRADAASRSLLGLINDAIDVSKIEAGQMLIESQPLRLEDVVAQAIERVRQAHGNPDVALVCDWADAGLLGAQGQLLGDAQRLQQVLVNLLSNALRFTPSGQVLLRLAMQPADAQDRASLAITVQDSGIGMSAEQLDGLFREPGPGGPAQARRDGGSGLGLGLTRRLVELMGGRLHVRSQPGRGSSFEVHLALPLDPQGQLPVPLRPQRVLLAKVAADAPEATLSLLRHLGLGPGLAASSDVAGMLVALAQARQAAQPFDWLLLDWRLPGPGATGAELLAQLRREHPGLRIAVLSPPGQADEPAQARAFGARALCPKPLLPGELRRLLGDASGDRPAGVDTQSLAGLRVLLVEDHAINQEIALRLLSSRGAQVELAANGQECLDRLRERGPAAYDLVLMDLQMPVMDGLSATRRLRELPGFETLPVLAMTAHALAEERAACAAAGMQGHIAKPLDVARLVRELQRYRPQAQLSPPPLLDLQLGLRQFDGQAALYRRTLQGFADQYADGLAAWPGWLARGDWAELRRAAHTLQGLAATLGARPLQRAAHALERSALAADIAAADEQLDHVRAGLALLQAEIQAALARPWDGAAPRGSGPGDVEELRQLLAQSDSQALDWWQAHGPHSGLDTELQRRLERALAALDFDAAAQALGPSTRGSA